MCSGDLFQPLNPEMNVTFGSPSLRHVFSWEFVLLLAGSIRTASQIHTLDQLVFAYTYVYVYVPKAVHSWPEQPRLCREQDRRAVWNREIWSSAE